MRDGEGAQPFPPEMNSESSIDADLGRDRGDSVIEVDVRAGAGAGGIPVELYVKDDAGNTYAAEGIRDEWKLDRG